MHKQGKKGTFRTRAIELFCCFFFFLFFLSFLQIKLWHRRASQTLTVIY